VTVIAEDDSDKVTAVNFRESRCLTGTYICTYIHKKTLFNTLNTLTQYINILLIRQ
jgi:hypothetical protein